MTYQHDAIEQLNTEKKALHYTVTEAAAMFGVTRQTIHNWIAAGRFPNHETVGEGGGMCVLLLDSDIDEVKLDEAQRLIGKLALMGY